MRRNEGACGRWRRIPSSMIADDVEPVFDLRHEILRVQESPRFVLAFALTDKPITGSMYGEEVLRLLGIGFEFLTQTHQVRVDGAGSWKVVVSPNVFEKTIAA